MGRNPAHKWLLIVEPPAQRQFNLLPGSTKQAIFRHLGELLVADDPYSLPFVAILKSDKIQRQRKFRVGDYRVFFAIEPVEVIDHKYQYKGTLFLLDILVRKDAYR